MIKIKWFFMRLFHIPMFGDIVWTKKTTPNTSRINEDELITYLTNELNQRRKEWDPDFKQARED